MDHLTPKQHGLRGGTCLTYGGRRVRTMGPATSSDEATGTPSAPWSGALLAESMCGNGPPQTLDRHGDLRITGGALVVPGDGPGVGLWRPA